MKQTIGQMLYEKRKMLHLHEKQIEREIQIKPEQLQWLEKDEFNTFPESFYVKNFLKRYAQFLEIDSELVLALYRRDYENNEIKRTNLRKETLKKANRETSIFDYIQIFATPFRLKLLGFILASLVLVSVTYFYTTTAFQQPVLIIQTPFELSNGYNGKIELNQRRVTLSGITEENIALTLNEQVVPLTIDNEYRIENIPVTEEGTQLELIAENALGVQASIVLNLVYVEPEIEEMNLEIRAEADIENVLVKAENIVVLNEFTSIGTVENFITDNFFEIECTNPSALRVLINDIPYNLENGTIFENKGTEIVQR